MANTEKKGIIPATTAVTYKDNFRISDDTIGKYISLEGGRKFYNPGIGLDLSTPNTGEISIVKEFKSNATDKQASGPTISSFAVANFIFLPTNTVTVNTLNGIGKTEIGVQSIPVNMGRDMSLMNTFIPVGNPVFIKAQEAGEYKVSFYSKGTVTNTVDNANFSSFNQFFIKIKGVESPLTNFIEAGSPGGKARPQSAVSSFEINYNATLTLAIGDVVEIYGKSNAVGYNGSKHTIRVNATTTTCSVSITQKSGPSQKIFTNPQGIAEMDLKSITFYGAGKDTLKLVGTKLTS